jgi:hypothetical protein
MSAVAGGTMFYRWWRMEEEDRGRVWRLYGWFTALMACGSCVGAVAWAARIMNLVGIYKANGNQAPAQSHSSPLFALAYSWRAAFVVTYAVEFLCLSAAKLMVLDRMSVFAAPVDTGARRQWAAAGRVVMAAVVLGNAAGLAANAAAAVHYRKASSLAANNPGSEYLSEVQLGGRIVSVQRFCEVAVLLFIVAAFAVVGVLSARRVSSRLLGVDAASAAAATGRALRRRMLATTAFVFVTFVLRSVLSIMSAVAFELRDFDKKCSGGFCDASCHNVYTFIAQWIGFTPEFEPTIVLISSPLTLLVALWGMTSKATLELMKCTRQETSLRLSISSSR